MGKRNNEAAGWTGGNTTAGRTHTNSKRQTRNRNIAQPRLQGRDIDVELGNLSNRKAHGNDGIPGEEYKATRKWAKNR